MFGGTFTPATPFFYSTGVSPGSAPSETGGVLRALPNTITLDGYTFGLDLSKSEISAQDTFRDNVAANAEPNDTLFNARGAWGRYQYSLHHGAGQELADLDPAADSFRFDTSYGVRWDQEYQATLLHSATNNRTVTDTNPQLIRSGDFVFASDGTTLYRSSDLTTWTAMTAPGGTIQAFTTDGTDLYVATTTGLVKYVGTATTPTAFATAVTGNCTNVAFCSGRLLLAKANVLYEVPGTGVLGTPIKTHYQSTFQWTTIFNVGSRIYIGGFSGTRSEIYSVATDNSGVLIQSAEAAPLPMGELLRRGASSAGVVILATNGGVRLAEVSGDGTLTYGPLITEPGDVRCIEMDGRFGFVGWSVMEGGRSGTARLVLDVDVQPLQPAIGTDVAESTTQANVTGIARLGGRTVFAVAGVGIWVESATNYVGQGVVRSGRIAFGTVEPKALIALTATFFPLAASQSVQVDVFNEYGVLIASAVQSTIDATTVEVDLGGEVVPFGSVNITLSGPGTTTPKMLRWRLRAYPVPPAVEQFVLGLNFRESQLVNGERGQTMTYNIDQMLTWIEGLWANRRYTVLRMGSRSYRVRVENFKLMPTEWTERGELPQGVLVVQLVAA